MVIVSRCFTSMPEETAHHRKLRSLRDINARFQRKTTGNAQHSKEPRQSALTVHVSPSSAIGVRMATIAFD